PMRGGLGVPWVMALIADGYLRNGAFKEALGAVTMGLAVTQVEGERHWEAELHRVKGETLLVLAAIGSMGLLSTRSTRPPAPQWRSPKDRGSLGNEAHD